MNENNDALQEILHHFTFKMQCSSTLIYFAFKMQNSSTRNHKKYRHEISLHKHFRPGSHYKASTSITIYASAVSTSWSIEHSVFLNSRELVHHKVLTALAYVVEVTCLASLKTWFHIQGESKKLKPFLFKFPANLRLTKKRLRVPCKFVQFYHLLHNQNAF